MDKSEVSYLRETQHRIKNNLQMITSMLNLQADCVDNPRLKDILMENAARIRAIALLQDVLYRSSEDGAVDMDSYIRKILGSLLIVVANGYKLDLSVDAAKLRLPECVALPCGLIVNELVTNAFKHAFDGKDTGRVRIRMKALEKEYLLSVADDGNGLPQEVSMEKSDSFGLRLVATLIEQLGGVPNIRRENGTEFEIRFSLEKSKKQTPLSDQG